MGGALDQKLVRQGEDCTRSGLKGSGRKDDTETEVRQPILPRSWNATQMLMRYLETKRDPSTANLVDQR